MSRVTPLKTGINFDGVLIHDGLPAWSVQQKCGAIRAAGVFEYVEKNFAEGEEKTGQLRPFLQAMQSEGLSLDVMGGIYRVGKDEVRLREGLAIAGGEGARLFNCQVWREDVEGQVLDAQAVADFFCMVSEWGDKWACPPCFEVHVDMWSEAFLLVEAVGKIVERRGIPFRLTLDLAHLLFKWGQPSELAKSGLTLEDAEELLHPDSPNALFRLWIARGWVVHAHARAVASPGPANAALKTATGQLGRGIQYPFIVPNEAGEFHAVWRAEACDLWRAAMQAMGAEAAHCGMPLTRISCEFLPFADYGGGARYDILANNIACAAWLKEASQKWSPVSKSRVENFYEPAR